MEPAFDANAPKKPTNLSINRVASSKIAEVGGGYEVKRYFLMGD